MSANKRLLRLFLSVAIGLTCAGSFAGASADSLVLYTPYTKVTLPPGETINYTVDLINNTSEIETVDLSLAGATKSWICTIKSEGLTIDQLSVLPHDKKSFTLTINVPLKVNKGTYNFRLMAGKHTSLPLAIIISEKGTFKTELTALQSNLQGHSNSQFTYTTTLKNQTADKQDYALMADAPRGWNVTFRNNYQAVTSISIDPNKSSEVIVEIKAPEDVESGTYKIPIRAVSGSTSAVLDLEAAVLGTYNMALSTPTGLLSTNLTAGESKKVDFLVGNTGSSALAGISLNFTPPTNWVVSLEPKTIANLLPGKTAVVTATIEASKKAIPGDYVINVVAKTPEVSAALNMRASVETPVLWGWVGVLIIAACLGGVYFLFRKYGRR